MVSKDFALLIVGTNQIKVALNKATLPRRWCQNWCQRYFVRFNLPQKIRKTPDFLSKSGIFMVAEAGLEPTTSGL